MQRRMSEFVLNLFCFYYKVNRVKEGTGVVISISENDGSNVIRIEGNHAGVSKAQTVCIIFLTSIKY